MNQSQRRYINKLNITLDRMLDSAEFRQKAKASGLTELVVAARLIENAHPQLSVISKHLIREQMLDAIENQQITPEDTAQIDTLLDDAPAKAPSSDARARMLAKMMAGTPDISDKTPSAAAKARMQSPMLEAQRNLQLDALVTSDEALEIAKNSDDPIVQAAVALRIAKHPTLSTAAKQRIHQQVVSRISKQDKPILIPNFAASLQRIAASIVILLFLGMLIAPSASADSLPSEPLYTVKRGLETVSLQLAFSDVKRVQIHLRLANERLDEITSLPATSQFKPQLFDNALTHLERASILVRDDIVQQNDLSAAVVRFETILLTTELDDTVRDAFVERYQVLQTANTVIHVPETTETQLPLVEMTAEVTELVPTASATATPETDTIAAQAEILYGYASAMINVRLEPLTYAEIITQIEPLQAVTAIGTTEDALWTQVELENGQVGWIASFLLATEPITPPIVDAPIDQPNTASVESNVQSTSTGSSGNGTSLSSTQGQSAVTDDDQQGNANGNANGNSNGNRGGNNDDDDDDDDD